MTMRLHFLVCFFLILLQRDVESIHGLVLLDDQPPKTLNTAIRLEINRWGGAGSGVPTHVSEDGEYWFHQLSEGEYEITAAAEGYKTFRSRVEVYQGGQVRGITKINLERGSDLPVITHDGEIISRNELRAPRGARQRLDEAQAAFAKGDLRKAEAAIQKALAVYPRYARAFFWKGRIFQRQGDLDQAASQYEQAISIDPDCYPAYLGLANCYREQARIEQLRGFAQKWKQRQPTDSAPYFYVAVAEYETGRYQEALREAMIALGFRHAQLPHLRLLLANIYVKLDRPAEALAELKVFLAENPEDPLASEAHETQAELTKIIEKRAGVPSK